MPNHLASETSPYLLGHSKNPVEWYPWGPEALARSRAEDKPIFLSIGYAACHWCHVMERESFENERSRSSERAFREHQGRPRGAAGLDEIYMTATVRALGQRRLADDGVSHARAAAVLRRHLLSRRATSTGARLSARCSSASPSSGRRSAGEL
jgi:hypothetical protein